jgi:formylglycine-generating enzyme required for sulfatase activity
LVNQSPPPDVKPEIRDQFWKRQANAAVCLFGLGEAEAVWPLLKHSPNPSLKSLIIDRLGCLGADYRPLIHRLNEESDPSIRQALILALGDLTSTQKLSNQERTQLLDHLAALYRSDPDPGVHSAVAWAFRQNHSEDIIARLDGEFGRSSSMQEEHMNRHWLINSQGQTFAVVDGPVDFLMGRGEKAEQVTIHNRFAVATYEMTVAQFQKFQRQFMTVPQSEFPAVPVSWFDAVAYCNWLSQQEGIAREQWCYEPNEKGEYAAGMKIPADFKQRTGYRLPTDSEWEYVCRAQTRTTFSFGEPQELLERYGWYFQNSGGRPRPVGQLKPNALGVFDMHGNAWEWCHDRFDKKKVVGSETINLDHNRSFHGGGFSSAAQTCNSAQRNGDIRSDENRSQRFQNIGFRPARTLP